MVRISDIVGKIRDRGRNGVKEVNKERKSIEERLREMNRKMIEECERGYLFNAAFIADQIRMLAESENVYPADINWRLVEELSRMLERSKVEVF